MLSHPLAVGGTPRRVDVGVAADLCVVGAPLGAVLSGLEQGDRPEIVATFIAGALVHRA